MNAKFISVLSGVFLAALSLAAQSASFTGTPTGSNNALALVGHISPSPQDIGKTVNVYVAAELNGLFFLKQANGGWVPLAWPLPVNKKVTAAAAIDVTITDGTIDLSSAGFNGLNIYVGYGTSDQDMLGNNKFGKIHSIVNNTPGAGLVSGNWRLTVSGKVNGAPFSTIVLNNIALPDIPTNQAAFDSAAQAFAENISQSFSQPGLADLTVVLSNVAVTFNPNIRGAVGDAIAGTFKGNVHVQGTIDSGGVTVPVNLDVLEDVSFNYERLS